MRLLDLFKRKPESPAEQEALENLDEVTREVSDAELGKTVGSDPIAQAAGAVLPPPVPDPDPGDSRGLRDALHEEDKPDTASEP